MHPASRLVLLVALLLSMFVPASAPVAGAEAAIGSAAPAVSPATARLTGMTLTDSQEDVPDESQVREALRSTAPLFIENVGQFDPEARFLVRGGGGDLWLAEDALWLTVLEPVPQVDRQSERFSEDALLALAAPASEAPRKGVALRLSFVGGNPAPRLEPFDRSETVVSYFIGNDPDAWRPDVPVWHGVRYVDLYPGLDLEVTGQGRRWAWRMVSKEAGARLDAVKLRVEGADAPRVDGGYLSIDTAAGALALPLLSMADTGGTIPAAGSPRVSGGLVEMPFGNATGAAAVVAGEGGGLIFSTLLGGSTYERSYDIGLDSEGRAYVAGCTDSSDYPTTPGGYDVTLGGDDDIFVSALDTTGAGLVFSTFLGGRGSDHVYSIAVDGAGRAYLAGRTESSDYVTTAGAYDTTFEGGDAFVSVLEPAGAALFYSTLLGGSSDDAGGSLAVDGTGRAYVTGATASANYPTTAAAYEMTASGGVDVFVSVLDPEGVRLDYSTFLGGSSNEHGFGIVVSVLGPVYVAGVTSSGDFPTTPGAYDIILGGSADVFVSVFDLTASGLVYSTFLGGSLSEGRCRVAVDGAGRAYVAGRTSSNDYPTTPGAYDTTRNGRTDVFVSVLFASGAGLVYSTYLGGSDDDYFWDMAIDGAGHAYVTGDTWSSDYPATPGAYDTTFNGSPEDVFVSVLNPRGSGMMYSTYLGGSDDEESGGVAVDGAGRACVVGVTDSSDYPLTPGAYDTTYNGGWWDVFVSVLDPQGAVRDLIAGAGVSIGDAELAWTAPSGSVAGYTVRYSGVPIDEASWASTIDVIGEPAPAPAGTPQSMTVTGLTPGQFYYFAMKAIDDQGLESPLSNVAVGINCRGAGGDLSPAAAAVRAVLGAQNWCGNAFEQLYTIPRVSAPDTGGRYAFEAFGDLAATARHEVDFVSMSWDDEVIYPDDDDPVSPSTDDGPMVLFLRGIRRLYDQVQADPVGYSEGVQVNILLGFRKYGLTGGGDQRAYVLSALGRLGVPLTGDRWNVRVAVYRDSPVGDVMAKPLWSTHSHVKMLIVDGKTAIVTGYNMENAYLSLAESAGGTNLPTWDAGLRVTGPIAQDALHVYEGLWRGALVCGATTYTGGEPGEAECFNEYWAMPLVHAPEVLSVAIPESASNDAVFSLFRDKGTDHEHDAEAAIEAALTASTGTVTVLQNRYMDLYPLIAVTAYQRGLDAALGRGVPVRLLLSQNKELDRYYNFSGAAMLSTRNGDPDTLEVRFAPPLQNVHGKALLVDGRFLIVGSENWDYSAFEHLIGAVAANDLAEYNLGTDSLDAANAFKSWYDWLWGQSGSFITLAGEVDIPRIVDIINSATVQSVIRLAPGVYPIAPLIGGLAAPGTMATPPATIAITQTLTLVGSGPGETILECTSPDQTLVGISAPGVLLEGLTIRNCGVAVQVSSNLGREATGTMIRNVVFVNNGRAVVVESGSALPVSLDLDSNTIVGGDAGLSLSIAGTQTFTSTVRNTIFDGHSVAPVEVLSAEGAPFIYSYNLFHGCGGGSCAAAWHTGDLGSSSSAHDNLFDMDPLFSDREARDYRLTLRSPAIDAGDPSISPVTDLVYDGNLDGVPRADIGAFEALTHGTFLPLIVRN